MTFRWPKKRWFLFFLLLGLGGAYQAIQARVSRPDIREFAEAKAREILRAEVQIGKIRYLPPAALSIQGIQIRRPEPAPASSIFDVEKLVIGYDFLNLLRRNFGVPGQVRLVRPKIRFSPGPSRPPFMDPNFSFSETVPTTFGIEGGEFRTPWHGGPGELVLQKVDLAARPTLKGEIRLDLKAELAGIAKGRIEVHGVTDPTFQHYDLNIKLEDASFLPESGVPLREIDGKFNLSDRVIQTKGVTSLFHDWEVEWKGRIEDWQTQPRLVFDVNHKKGKFPFQFSGEADFTTGRLWGKWVWVGHAYPFQGKIAQGEKKIIFSALQLPKNYTGGGEFDFATGDYRMKFEREQRRFQIHSNVNRLDFQTEFQLDHAQISHMDWVMLARVHIRPLTAANKKAPLRFKADVKTEYLIMEYEPLQDFEGNFELDEEGLQMIDAHWGGVFQLGGRVPFKGGKPRVDLLLRIDGYSLDSTRDLGGRPLPQNLRGNLEGKLKLAGEWSRPEVQGYFTIKDGQLDKLDYDRAVIQFRGFPPYLKLYDSKIFRGRSTLTMLGAINLSLRNIFRGVQIKGPDHLVIWKGMSAFWKEGESAIEAEKPLTKQVSMGLEVGAGQTKSEKQEPEESHAVLGPKVRF